MDLAVVQGGKNFTLQGYLVMFKPNKPKENHGNIIMRFEKILGCRNPSNKKKIFFHIFSFNGNFILLNLTHRLDVEHIKEAIFSF